MRYWLDTEFIDTGTAIDLISIGIAAEDGRELYLQSCEFNLDKASPWVREHVLLPLPLCPSIITNPPYSLGTVYGALAQHKHGQCVDQWRGQLHNCPWRTREQMRKQIQAFFDPSAELDCFNPSPRMEWHAWCGSHDLFAICQLFGGMLNLPPGYPHYIHDFQQLLDERGISDDELPEQEEGLHNALQDARHLKKLWGYIMRNDAWQ